MLPPQSADQVALDWALNILFQIYSAWREGKAVFGLVELIVQKFRWLDIFVLFVLAETNYMTCHYCVAVVVLACSGYNLVVAYIIHAYLQKGTMDRSLWYILGRRAFNLDCTLLLLIR